jgi:hypothetical protein
MSAFPLEMEDFLMGFTPINPAKGRALSLGLRISIRNDLTPYFHLTHDLHPQEAI